MRASKGHYTIRLNQQFSLSQPQEWSANVVDFIGRPCHQRNPA